MNVEPSKTDRKFLRHEQNNKETHKREIMSKVQQTGESLRKMEKSQDRWGRWLWVWWTARVEWRKKILVYDRWHDKDHVWHVIPVRIVTRNMEAHGFPPITEGDDTRPSPSQWPWYVPKKSPPILWFLHTRILSFPRFTSFILSPFVSTFHFWLRS